MLGGWGRPFHSRRRDARRPLVSHVPAGQDAARTAGIGLVHQAVGTLGMVRIRLRVRVTRMAVIVAVIVGKAVVGSFRRRVHKAMHTPDLV